MLENWFFENDEAENLSKDTAEKLEGPKESGAVELTALVEESKKNTVQGVCHIYYIKFKFILSLGSCGRFTGFDREYSY